MMWKLLLDVLPYDGRPRHPHIIKPLEPKVIIQPDTASDQVVDSAQIQNMTDSVAAGQDFFIGNGAGGDDMTMLFAGIFVVFFALTLCLYFVYKYRQLNVKV